MRKLLLAFFFVLSIKSFAQREDRFYQQLYLHFDKASYVAGDTVWFKSYVLADLLPDLKTHNLFIELLNTEGHNISSPIVR